MRRRTKEALSWVWCGLLLGCFLYGISRMPGDDVTAEPQYRDFPVQFGQVNECPRGWNLQEPVTGDTFRCWRVIK
jgi:hypothetical protein